MNERSWPRRIDQSCVDCGVHGIYHSGLAGRCCECRDKVNVQTAALSAPAHRAVRMAIKKGWLPPLSGSIKCVDCGDPATIYDHRSYIRPLDVEPVCRQCNMYRGPAIEVAHLRIRLWPRPLGKRLLCGPLPQGTTVMAICPAPGTPGE